MFTEYIEAQRRWSRATFGEGLQTQSRVVHIRKELVEIEENPRSLAEWIDIVSLALDGAWRTGASPAEIVAELWENLRINRDERVWIIPDNPDEPMEHDRTRTSGEQQAKENTK